MGINQEQFDKVKTDAESFYNTINEVRCPYFKENIKFNIKGLDHLKFKGWNKTRLLEDQYRRFKLIRMAPEVVRLSNTLQGFTKLKKMERRKVNSRWEIAMIDVNYFEFVAVLSNFRVKVIIKQLAGGERYFWSIYPFWRTGQDNKNRLLFSGNPETD